MVWEYKFYFLVLKTIFYSVTELVRKKLFLPLENKIHIFAQPCDILYLSDWVVIPLNTFFVDFKLNSNEISRERRTSHLDKLEFQSCL